MNVFVKEHKLTILLMLCAFVMLIFAFNKYQESNSKKAIKYIDGWERVFFGHEIQKEESAMYPVEMVLFYDYECPYWQKFDTILEELKSGFKNTLQISYQHRILPGHNIAYDAAIASECAKQQNSFEIYHNQLFKRTFSLSNVDFIELAEISKIEDILKFTRCFNNEETAPIVDREISLSDSLGIFEVPSYLINGKLYKGATSKKVLSRLIKKEIKSKPR